MAQERRFCAYFLPDGVALQKSLPQGECSVDLTLAV